MIEISQETFMQLITAATRNLDWKRFGETLAINDPNAFIRTLSEMNGIERDDPWKNEVRSMVEDGATRLDIVKYVRDHSAMSLSEVRSWVTENYPQLEVAKSEEV